jgi:hypothetical protein
MVPEAGKSCAASAVWQPRFAQMDSRFSTQLNLQKTGVREVPNALRMRLNRFQEALLFVICRMDIFVMPFSGDVFFLIVT